MSRQSLDVTVSVDPLYRYRFATTSNCLNSQPTRVENQLALQIRCREALFSEGDYEKVLAATVGTSIDPTLRVFQQRAGLSIWAGSRSNLVFEWLQRRPLTAGKFDLAAFVFLSWGALSPLSLRWMLARMVDWKNKRAKRALGSVKVVDWS
jgi:hypothetical protein